MDTSFTLFYSFSYICSLIPTLERGGPEDANPKLPIEQIERIYNQSRLEHAIAVASSQPLKLIPNPLPEQTKQEIVELPSQPLSIKENTITIASFTLTPENINRTITFNGESFELLSIEVKPENNSQVTVVAGLRYEAEIGNLWLETERAMIMSMLLYENIEYVYHNQQDYSIYESQTHLAITKIKVDPSTGIWTELVFSLLQNKYLTGYSNPEMVLKSLGVFPSF